MTVLNKKTDDFRDLYNEFTLEATKLTEPECQEVYGKCMEAVLTTRGKDEVASLPADQLEEFKRNRDQMRMYSFKQLWNIFTVTNNNSEMHDRMTTAEENIQTLFKNVQELRDADASNRNFSDSEF